MRTTPALKTTRGSQSIAESQLDGSPLSWTQSILLLRTAPIFATGGQFAACAIITARAACAAVGVTFTDATLVARAPKNGAEAVFTAAVSAACTRTRHKRCW